MDRPNTSSPVSGTPAIHSAVLIGGSNIGDRLHHLETARRLLEASGCIVLRESAAYLTAPWGNTEQEDFVNRAWLVQTQAAPQVLLETILAIEEKMGRTRHTRWEPRRIDIDILFYDEAVLHTDQLVIPHPRLQERRFALVPTAEIVPQWVHPVLKKNVARLLAETPDRLDVRKYVAP